MTRTPALRPRASLRLRLTALYSGLFLIAGAALLAINYGFMRNRLPQVGVLTTPDLVYQAAEPFSDRLPLALGGRAQAEVFTVALNTEVKAYRSEALRQLVTQSSTALAVMAVASVLLGWVISGRVLRPLAHITGMAKRISEQNLHERIALDGPGDELKDLADTFDAMLARLEAAFVAQQRFAASAAHELRTPIANQRTVLEIGLADGTIDNESVRAVRDQALAQVSRQQAIVERLLLLARADRVAVRERVNLADVAREALASLRLPPDLRVHASIEDAFTVGDRVLLERMVHNLLENAGRYNLPGGWIAVTVGAPASVVVRNSGSLIGPDEVPQLFEAFHRRHATRVRSSLDGVGLGLTIVEAVVRCHGGSIGACPEAEGGLRVEVQLAPEIRNLKTGVETLES